MISSTFSLRVRYGETDQMGIVYHGNYASYCEVARIEFFREKGLPYKELEENGYMLPVVELNLKFRKSAYYDDILNIETTLLEIPEGAKLKFDYKIYNQNEELLLSGYSMLAFVDKLSRKPVRCPDYMIKKLKDLIQD